MRLKKCVLSLLRKLVRVEMSLMYRESLLNVCLASKNYTYRERLAAGNLDTLEFRRLRFDLIMCYKIVFGL